MMTQPFSKLAANVNEGCAETLYLPPDPQALTRALGIRRTIMKPLLLATVAAITLAAGASVLNSTDEAPLQRRSTAGLHEWRKTPVPVNLRRETWSSRIGRSRRSGRLLQLEATPTCVAFQQGSCSTRAVAAPMHLHAWQQLPLAPHPNLARWMTRTGA
jgi:hypothetical protein